MCNRCKAVAKVNRTKCGWIGLRKLDKPPFNFWHHLWRDFRPEKSIDEQLINQQADRPCPNVFVRIIKHNIVIQKAHRMETPHGLQADGMQVHFSLKRSACIPQPFFLNRTDCDLQWPLTNDGNTIYLDFE